MCKFGYCLQNLLATLIKFEYFKVFLYLSEALHRELNCHLRDLLMRWMYHVSESHYIRTYG